MFRTRQAPSPTGYLHIGTARTVLFTKLMAKINNGVYYLRLEDTDRNRLVPEAAKILLSALNKIGLEPDEGLTLTETKVKSDFYDIYQKGNFGPYIQSERLEIYHEHAQKLIDKGLAYWNFLSAEERAELQEIKTINKRPIDYYKICSEKYGEEEIKISLNEAMDRELKPVLMYKLQQQGKLICSDVLLGQTEFDLSLEEDFTIIKSDGYPTYHLAHLVDDYLMETSLVVRSQEWYPSLPKHTKMFLDYWKKVPDYIHLPFILSEVGNKKMSKRDGNVNLQDYIDKGFLPEAIINYISFLGWNPGTEKEMYLEASDFTSLNETGRLEKLISNLAKDFSLDKLSKSPARFNLEKLTWMNKHYISMLSLPEFVKTSAELGFLDKGKCGDQSKYLGWQLDKNRATLLSQIGLESDCLYNWSKPDFELLKWKDDQPDNTKGYLKLVLKEIENLWPKTITLRATLEDSLQNYLLDHTAKEKFDNDFNNLIKFWEENLKSFISNNNLKAGNVFWPLRTALSGKAKSPSPFELLSCLELEEVQFRLNSLVS
jgi:nondiscriminating glutamyl-tRNA synthetase